MRVWFALLSLLLLALAGCTDSSDDGDSGTSSSSSSSTGSSSSGSSSSASSSTGSSSGSSSSSSSSSGVPASGPSANLKVTVPEGFAPVNVKFNFSAIGYEVEDFVDWTLDVDDDGVVETQGSGGFGVGYVQTFTEAGNYTARFTADDGNEFVEATATFVIIGEPVLAPQDPIQLTGTAGPGALGFPESIDNLFTVEHAGQTVTIKMSYSDPAGDLDWTITDGNGATVADTAADGPEADVTQANAAVGEWNVNLQIFYAVQTAYTLDITFS